MRVTQQVVITVQGTETLTIAGPVKGYWNYSMAYTFTVSPGTASPVGPFNWDIDWGDGSAHTTGSGSSTAFAASHAFAGTITYPATVTITAKVTDSGNGVVTTKTAQVQIVFAVSGVSLTATPTSGVTPLPVSFLGHVTNPGFTPGTWSLDFGDGSAPVSGGYSAAGDLPVQAHTYTAVGAFTAILTVTDALGTATQQSLTIRAGVLAVSVTPILVVAPMVAGIFLVAYAGWKKA